MNNKRNTDVRSGMALTLSGINTAWLVALSTYLYSWMQPALDDLTEVVVQLDDEIDEVRGANERVSVVEQQLSELNDTITSMCERIDELERRPLIVDNASTVSTSEPECSETLEQRRNRLRMERRKGK